MHRTYPHRSSLLNPLLNPHQSSLSPITLALHHNNIHTMAHNPLLGKQMPFHQTGPLDLCNFLSFITGTN
jgi:hypothetical protein